jgi:hypothetical protein
LFLVKTIEVKELGYNDIGYLIINFGTQKNDTFFQQQTIDIIGALTPTVTINDHGNYAGVECHIVYFLENN